MLVYRYTPDDGPERPATDLTIAEIHDILAVGVQIVDDHDCPGQKPFDVHEQLRAILVAKQLGLIP